VVICGTDITLRLTNKGNNKITEHRAIFQRESKTHKSTNRQSQSTTASSVLSGVRVARSPLFCMMLSVLRFKDSDYPSGGHEFILGFKRGSCRSISSLLYNVVCLSIYTRNTLRYIYNMVFARLYMFLFLTHFRPTCSRI
jgi:hypothetical protein